MKKLIYGGIILAILGTSFFSCEKKDVKESVEVSNLKNDSSTDKNTGINAKVCEECWALAVAIIGVIEPVRFHRGTDNRPRDGVNCGCNQCFGACWAPGSAPYNGNSGVTGRIALSEIVDGFTTIYFLDALPSNFETEFGIDDPLNIYLDDETFITLKMGEYSAENSRGVINPDGENLQVYGSVRVEAVQ